MSGGEVNALLLSLLMGVSSVALGLIPATGLAWLLARRQFLGKTALEAVVFMPLVIPPVVTGYILLVVFGRNSWAGQALALVGLQIPFTRLGMALAGTVMGFPLLVRTIRGAFEAVEPWLESAARTLGCSRLETFFAVTLPLAWPGLVAGSILCFARALGEFGATVMMSPGTEGYRTIPLEIFRSYQTPGGEEAVFRMALISVAISAVALGASELLVRRFHAARKGETGEGGA